MIHYLSYMINENKTKMKDLKNKINEILSNKNEYPSSIEIIKAFKSLSIKMTSEEYKSLDYSVKPTISNYYKWIATFELNMKPFKMVSPAMPNVVEKVSSIL
jgi:hypothetical protein